jgi:FkbM family methyltransferase
MEIILQKYGSNAWHIFRTFYVEQLRLSNDDRSIATLKHLLDLVYCYFYKGKRITPAPRQFQIDDQLAYRREEREWRRKYPRIPHHYIENFYQHHGLRLIAPDIVRRYVATRDILDVGAAVGDSLVLLQKYTVKRVISYELIPGTARLAAQFGSEQCIILNVGLADSPMTIQVSQTGSGTSGLHSRGPVWVNVSTIDIETKRLNLSIGMIKADIEGAEMMMLHGATETLKKHRPVLALSLYHNERMLEIPKFISEMG